MSTDRSAFVNALLSNMLYQYPFKGAGELLKRVVWAKGREIPNYDPAVWRWDVCGNVMKYSEHGNTESEHGWEIDHVIPRAKDGKSTPDNLQPLNWKNNRRKGDTYPWRCS